MEHVAPILLACVAAMTALGAVGRFVWNKIEKRFTDIEDALEECTKRELDAANRREIYRGALELIWAELKRLEPKSPILARAKKLMDDLKVSTPD